MSLPSITAVKAFVIKLKLISYIASQQYAFDFRLMVFEPGAIKPMFTFFNRILS